MKVVFILKPDVDYRDFVMESVPRVGDGVCTNEFSGLVAKVSWHPDKNEVLVTLGDVKYH